MFVYNTDKQKLYIGNAWQPFALASQSGSGLLTTASAAQPTQTLGFSTAISGSYAVASAAEAFLFAPPLFF